MCFSLRESLADFKCILTIDEICAFLRAGDHQMGRIFTVDEVARLQRLTTNAVRERCARGMYPGAYKDGKRWAIPEEALPEPIRSRRPTLPEERRIIAVVNQKGGVAKTITSINLSCALARLGHRVLLVDLDGQANCTTGLGVDKHELELTIANVLTDRPVPLSSIVVPLEGNDNSYLAPSNIRLQRVERDLIGRPFSHARLSRALAEYKEPIDFVIIDCPPSLGVLFVNAIYAATDLLVAIAADYFSLEGVTDLLDVVEEMEQETRHSPRMHVLLTKYDARTNVSQEAERLVRAHFPDELCQTVIRVNSKLAEATGVGKSIFSYMPSSRGAKDYMRLAKEVTEWPVPVSLAIETR
jgi:chromosome partitioning protein